jgi:NDP-sugar pyrophosphorylase family protein
MTYSKNFIPIVLCAGFGTRLKPITDFIPKVICPIIDKPLAFFSIEKFFQSGFEHVYCNTHYMADFVKEELQACAKAFGYDPNRIIFFHETDILGSGGGILNIVQHLRAQSEENKKKDVIVVSGDVVADFPLNKMIQKWQSRKSNELALMLSLELMEDRDDVMWVSNENEYVVGFGQSFLQNASEHDGIKRLFSNHQIIGAENFDDCVLKNGSSVQMFYKKILSQPNKKILHDFYPQSAYWFNVGDIAEYKKCVQFFCAQKNISYPVENKLCGRVLIVFENANKLTIR